VDLIRAARAEGLTVSGEASPHHLLLTEQACAALDTRTKVNPPLRTENDVRRLLEGVADGTISVLATDHAPHPATTKSRPFANASFGLVGLECALPLYARALLGSGALDWPRLLALMTLEPARLVGLDRGGLGALATGGPGDVTVIDPELEWVIDSVSFASAGRNCPFDGWPVRGRAILTIVGGRVCYGEPGSIARMTCPSSPA
jgi:dihydroorotase